MKVGVWSYYSVGRPPVKFCRIQSSFDSPTVIYIAAPLPVFSSDVFGLRKPVSGCSSFLSSQSNPPTQPESSPLNPPPTGTVRLRSEGSETPLTLAPSLYIYTFPSPFLDKPSLNLSPTSSQPQSPPPPRIPCTSSLPLPLFRACHVAPGRLQPPLGRHVASPSHPSASHRPWPCEPCRGPPEPIWGSGQPPRRLPLPRPRAPGEGAPAPGPVSVLAGATTSSTRSTPSLSSPFSLSSRFLSLTSLRFHVVSAATRAPSPTPTTNRRWIRPEWTCRARSSHPHVPATSPPLLRPRRRAPSPPSLPFGSCGHEEEERLSCGPRVGRCAPRPSSRPSRPACCFHRLGPRPTG